MKAEHTAEALIWWRFADYQIQDGMILPVPGARGTGYNPLRRYRAANSAGPKQTSIDPNSRAAYLEVLDLANSLAPTEERVATNLVDGDSFGLTDFETDAILTFVRRNGLLGIFHQDVVQAARPDATRVWVHWGGQWLMEDVIDDDASARPGGMLDGVSNGEEPADLLAREGEERASAKRRLASVIIRANSLLRVDSDARSDLGWAGSGCLAAFQGGPLHRINFVELAQRFFTRDMPSPIPHPESEEFFRHYGEGVTEFILAVSAFRSAIEEFLNSDDPSSLNLLLSRNSRRLRVRDGEITEETIYPSLLALLADTFLRDQMAGLRLDRCDGCGQWFRTNFGRTRFCSDPCRWRLIKRSARAKTKPKRASRS